MTAHTEEEIVLEWRRYVAQQSVTRRRLLEEAEFSVVCEIMFNTLSMRLTKDILTHKTASASRTYVVPATWWDHFKRDALNRRGLRWLRDRLGVMTVTRVIAWEQGLRFPYAQYPRQLGRPIRFVRELS